MMNDIIEATILNVKFKGEDVLLPRIPMIPTDISFEFKRLQYPVGLAFAMTINKAHRHRSKIHASHMENCMSLAHALENLSTYSCTHQKEKQKIL
jgi:ATP-dependent DNA helicase PIF1